MVSGLNYVTYLGSWRGLVYYLLLLFVFYALTLLYNVKMLGTAPFKEVHGYWLVVVVIIHVYLTLNRPVLLFSDVDSRRIVLELCDSQLEACLRNHQDIKLAAQNLSDLLAAVYKNKV